MAMNKAGVQAVWDNAEQTVIRYDVHTSWSIHDLQRALDAGAELARTVQHPVDVLVNIVKPALPRLEGFSFEDSAGGHKFDDAQGGLVVIAANNVFVKNTLLFFLKINSRLRQIVFVTDTLVEARELLTRQRAGRANRNKISDLIP